MSIVELDINDLISVGKFKKFYDETFVRSFDINEIQSFEQYLQIKTDEVKYLGEYEYHFCFIEKDEQYSYQQKMFQTSYTTITSIFSIAKSQKTQML